MNIRNTTIVLLIFLVFSLLFAHKVFASVYINEVELSPTEERFIELYNSGSSSVDLTNWYLQRKTATGTSFSSLISKTYFGGQNIGAHSYFVISKNDINNSDLIFSKLTLTESNTIQLKNSEQEVVDIVGWGEADDSYVSNPASGKSIQRYSSGDWFVDSPTPGEENSNSSSDDDEEDDEEDDEDSEEDEEEEIDIFKIITKINFPKILTAGILFSFHSLTADSNGITYNVGKFVWNFGDGTIMTVKSYGPLEYTYEYPGEYVVNLSYFKNTLTEVPDATDKITIKVIPADIYISGVGNNADPYIEIENKSKYDIDLSSWIIIAGQKVFAFPTGTSILKGGRIKLSPKITHFTGDDLKYLIIQNPRGDIVATYPIQNKKTVITSASQNVASNVSKKGIEERQEEIKEENNEPQIINLNDLEASASNSNIHISNKVLASLGLVSIIILGIISFLFIKKKNKSIDENIEGEISVDDIKIIE